MTVGIVGAGITGLALVYHLRERGVDAVAFEAAPRPGGVVRSGTVDGRVLEYGPQRVRLTDELAALVDAASLREELLVADDGLPLYVYADGRLREVPRSLAGLLETDVLSWRGKLRLLAEPLTAPGRPEETAAELFVRKFGPEAYRRLIEPLFGGIYGSDPARMPARYSLSGLLRLEERSGSLLRAALGRVGAADAPPPASFESGLQALPEALYERHREAVELSTPVESLRPDGEGYALGTEGRTVAVDEVVITARADRTADVLDDVAPSSAEALSGLRYNPLAIVHLLADVDREGFGYQVARDEGLSTLGVSWNASMFDREGVFTCFLGGMDDPGILDAADEELGRIAREEFRGVMGAEARVLDVTRLPRAFPAYDESWAALDDVDLPPGVTLATNYTARMGVPGRVREANRLAEALARS